MSESTSQIKTTNKLFYALLGALTLLIVLQVVGTQPADVQKEVLRLRALVMERTDDRFKSKEFENWEKAFFKANPQLNRPQ